MHARVRSRDWRSRKKIVAKEIVAQPHRLLHDPLFLLSPDPVAWTIRRGYVLNPDTFYHELARSFKLAYQAELPFYLNPTQAPLPKLSLETMAQQLVFHFTKNNQSFLAIANPCLSTIEMQTLLQQLPADTTIVLSPHGVIKEALSFYNAYFSLSSIEHNLSFAKPEYSSQLTLRQSFLKPILFLILITILGVGTLGGHFFSLLYAVINIFYFLMNPFKVILFLAGLKKKETASIAGADLAAINDADLPYYTLIVPLKGESAVVPRLIQSLKSMFYPIEKLDIKIAVEVNDRETLESLAQMGFESSQYQKATPDNILFHLVKVPAGSLSTKPRSCNFALKLARGVLTVIYDAEDKPDPWQLKKAWHVFMSSKLNTLCIQSKLTFYNTKHNLLTRFFTLEYGFWFDTFLPGLQAMKIPLPLGGTSNHFLTASLRRVGGWDSYNVTEDADLGWRLSRYQYQTVVMDSYTQEEAMSELWGWVKQRTRWQKGFIVTFFVHSRNMGLLYQELGLWRFISSLVVYSTNILLPLINPILWVVFINWYLFPLLHLPVVRIDAPEWIGTISGINLVFGNLAYILIHFWAALKQRKFGLLVIAILMPFYWPLLSFATYRAVWQFLRQPSYWEKTKHGLT